MTKTWTQLRRELSRDLREPVFRRVGNEITINGSAADEFYSTALGKISNEFGLPYGFAYCHYTTDGGAPAGEELEITDFVSDGTTGYAYVEPSASAVFGNGDKVEIHELWSVAEKLDAVNKAIDDCWPAFYRRVVDQTIILQKYKREYDLSELSVTPRHIIHIYVEPMYSIGSGKATSGSASYLVDANKSYTLESGKSYEIAIYAGTGAGQVRTVTSWTEASHTFVVSPNWTTVPDDTSEYIVKNLTDVFYNWMGPVTRFRLNQTEYPTKLELPDVYALWGARLRIEYAANLAHMENESSSLDDVSANYVLMKAKYRLYAGRISTGPQSEIKSAATSVDLLRQEAAEYREQNRMERLRSTIRTELNSGAWSDTELPFRS